MPAMGNSDSLFKEFRKNNTLHDLFNKDQILLLACSGGIDSMVLLDLLVKLNQPFAVAHVNFQLRGEESNKNHDFVIKTCRKLGIKLHDKLIKLQHSSGIQERARETRYTYFKELISEFNYSYVVTAHHADDQLETMLFNLARGTGLQGLGAMRLVSDKLLRPLLFASRKQIENYAMENSIEFSLDSSNEKINYSRNKIRKLILPVLREINPEVSKHAYFTSRIIQNLIQENPNPVSELPIFVSRKQILNKSLPFEWLNQFLVPYGFNKIQLETIFLSLKDKKTGREFNGKIGKLITTKSGIELHGLNSRITLERRIIIPEVISTPYGRIEIQVLDNIPVDKTDSNEIELFFDLDKLESSLSLVPIKSGMLFFPKGLNGRKKVNDYLSDIGVSKYSKEEIYCLKSGNRIAAILPYTVSKEFMPDNATEFVLSIRIKKLASFN